MILGCGQIRGLALIGVSSSSFSLALAGGVMTRTDFRSSPWFAVAFVDIAVILPGSCVVLFDSGVHARVEVDGWGGSGGYNCVIAWFAWR